MRGLEYCYLFVVRDGFEGGSHGDFGFAIANVAAEQAVHWRRLLEIALYVGDGCELVGCLLEFESVFEFALPVAIGRKREARGGLAFGVEDEQLIGHVFEGFANAGLARGPGGASAALSRG